MTTEQKAKAYDEALKEIRELISLLKKNNVITDNGIIESNLQRIFPQLRESEDEQSHKRIEQLIRLNTSGAEKTHLLAYLEKQKKQSHEDEKHTDFTIYHPLKNGKGKYECIPYSFHGSLTSFSENKDLIDFLRTCFYTKEECNKWIEQQKEQKPEIKYVYPTFKVGDTIKPKAYNESHRINEIKDGNYVLDNGFTFPIVGQDVWEVVEQKPADFPATDEEVKEFLETHQKVEISEKYKTPDFVFSKQDYSGLTDLERAIHRGLLSAGGKKIPVTIIKETAKECLAQMKPTEWSEEDQLKRDNLIGLVEEIKRQPLKRGEDWDGYINWLKSLQARFNLQPKQEWNQDDEQYLLVCKNALQKYQRSDQWDANIISNWLEERLKSNRPQPHWKPSNEQMNHLSAAVIEAQRRHNESVNGFPRYRVLKELYEQLKKLM